MASASMKENVVATFDIGGTNIRAATVVVTEGHCRILDRRQRATPNYLIASSTSARALLDHTLDFIVDYAIEAQLTYGAISVAAAFPGPVRGKALLLGLPTIWGADGAALCPIDLQTTLAVRLPGLAIHVMNDVTAAGYRFVPGGPDFAILTLGSGVGLKVFIAGQPCLGPNDMGGELTHMVFDHGPDAPLCDCGGRGHLGALVSGRAWNNFLATCRESGATPNMVNFFEPLARALAMLHFALGLERFILAGGLSEGLGEALRASVVANMPAQGWNLGQNWDAMITLAPSDDSHALIGGALAATLNA